MDPKKTKSTSTSTPTTVPSMTMPSMTYAERLAQTPAAADAEKLAYKVEQTALQAGIDVSKAKEAVAGLRIRLIEAESKYPFSMNDVISADNNLELALKNLAKAEAICARLFPV